MCTRLGLHVRAFAHAEAHGSARAHALHASNYARALICLRAHTSVFGATAVSPHLPAPLSRTSYNARACYACGRAHASACSPTIADVSLSDADLRAPQRAPGLSRPSHPLHALPLVPLTDEIPHAYCDAPVAAVRSAAA
eukprot:6183148-Pleurochrysis_carterae.AAC.3